MALNIEQLSVTISASSTKAKKQVDALVESVRELKKAFSGIENTASSIGKLTTAFKGLTEINKQTKDAANSVNNLAKGLDNFRNASKSLTGIYTSIEVVNSLVTSLSKLEDEAKAAKSIGTALNNIAKGVETFKTFKDSADDIERSANTINMMANAMKNLGDASATLKGITTTVKNVQKATSGAGTEAKNQSNNAKTGIDKIKASIDGMRKSLTNAGGAFSSFLREISVAPKGILGFINGLNSSVNGLLKGFIALGVGANRIYSKLRTVIDLSNKYQEDYNLFTVSLGEYAQAAEEYANKVADVMGIDPADWMRNQGVFNTIIKGFGVAGDRAYTMSTQLTQLGYDLSSLYNLDVSEAFKKLQSGISGELEPLRQLGYDLSVARLEQEKANVTFKDTAGNVKDLSIALDDATLASLALDKGITKSVADMTQAEKSQLRYFAIMTQVTDAQGDMSRTLDAPANQLRVLSAQFTMLGREIGNIFIPVLNKLLPYITAVTKAVRTLAAYLADLAGFQLTEVDYSSVKTVSQIEDIEDAWDGATSKAKEFKKFLLGIDELNIIPSTNPSGRGNEGDNSAGWRDFDLPTYDFLGDASQSKVNSIYDRIISLFKENDPQTIGDTIKDWIVKGLDKIPWDQIQAGAHTVGEKVAKFLNGLLNPSENGEKGLGEGIGGAVGGALGTIGNLFGGFFENAEFDKWAESLGQFISKAFKGVHIDIDSLFGDEGLGGWLGGEIKALKDNPEMLAALSVAAVSLGTTFGKEFFGAAFAGYTFGSLLTRGIEAISGDEHYEGGFFSQMADIKESFTDGSWKEAASQWAMDISDGFMEFGWDLSPIKWIEDFGYWLAGYEPPDYDNWFDHIGGNLEQFKTNVTLFGAIVKEYWTDRIEVAKLSTEEFIDACINFGEKISENNEKVRQNIITTLASIKVHWLNLKNSISETVTNMTSKVSQFATDVKNFFAPVLVVINNVKSAFDSLAKLDFSKLGGVLNLENGGNAGLIEILSKYFERRSFATGGFPEDGLFFANHGELVGSFSNGRTAVANNDQIVAGISEGVRSAVLSALSSSGIVEAVMSGKSINIDGREIMNVVVNQNNRAINRTGVSPIRT